MLICNMYFVFLYGILKRGQFNYYYMVVGIELGDCELVGFGVMLIRYFFIVDQFFNILFLLDVIDNFNVMVSNVDEEIGENLFFI